MPCYDLLIQADSMTSWHLSVIYVRFSSKEKPEFAFAYFLQKKADVGIDYPTFYVAAIPSTAVSESG